MERKRNSNAHLCTSMVTLVKCAGNIEHVLLMRRFYPSLIKIIQRILVEQVRNPMTLNCVLGLKSSCLNMSIACCSDKVNI